MAIVGKNGLDSCEDAVVVTATHAAVIDGATDLTGATYSGRTGGQIAARAVADAVRSWPGDIGWAEAVADATQATAQAIADAGKPDRKPTWLAPRAVAAIYSAHWRQVWSIGDCEVRIGADVHTRPLPGSDTLGQFRRLWLASERVAGVSDDELRAGTDPGLLAAGPLLERIGRFANTVGNPYAYGVFDGSRVPGDCVAVLDVPVGAEVVLATDGHIDVTGDLAHAEHVLAAAVRADPLALHDRRLSRATPVGATGFDDRSWIRLTA